jgi:hypothetical protein
MCFPLSPGSTVPYHTTRAGVQAWHRAADNPSGVFRLASLALVLAQAVPAAAEAQPATSASVAPLAITRCVVTKPRPFSHRATGTTIAFVNQGPTLVHRVTFSLRYRSGDQIYDRTIDDAGIFAPNTPVEHHYPTYSDVDYAGPELLACRVIATG